MNEIESDRPGTLYNSLLYHSPDGELALHHRKLVPTNHERLIWGQGDGRGLHAVDTGFGRIGGLICWENYMPLARVALYESGVEIYVASTADDGDEWQATLVHIARESRAYVISPCHFQRASSYPDDFPLASELEGADILGRGGSAILAPDGSYLAGPLYERGGDPLRRARPVGAARGAAALRPRRALQPAGRARAQRSRARCDAEYTSFRAIRPSLIGKTSTPSHSSFRPSFSTFSVHSHTAKSSPACMLRVRKRHAGIVREDPADVLAHGVGALGALVGRVVVEDDLGMVQRVDRRRDPAGSTRRCSGRSGRRPRLRSCGQCPTSAQDALVADAAREAVGVEALEQELRRLAADAEQVAEAGERDPALASSSATSAVRACSYAAAETA